jgi:long-subunit fatty acid transport protein
MSLRIRLLIVVLFFVKSIYSQQNENHNFWENVQFGGGLNVGISNNITNLGISPSAIYNFNDQFSAGLSVSYLYSKHKDIDEALNIYGGSVLGLYNLSDEILISAEFEENIISQSGFDSRNVEALYFGLGYSVGENVTFGMRYDVLYDEDKSIYGSAFSPIVRVYF